MRLPKRKILTKRQYNRKRIIKIVVVYIVVMGLTLFSLYTDIKDVVFGIIGYKTGPLYLCLDIVMIPISTCLFILALNKSNKEE